MQVAFYFMIKLIIFDLDGTLVNAYQAIISSVNFTLRKIGYPAQSSQKILKAVGWGDKSLLGAFVKEQDIEKALVIYRRHHKVSLARLSRLLPFVKGTLDYLKCSGLKLAIASNRPTEFTNLILRRLKIKEYFAYCLCADKLAQGKPHPEILLKVIEKLDVSKKEALYVGDMAIDALAGNNAGIKTVIVKGGLSTLKEIKAARPYKVIETIAYLKNIAVDH